MINLILALFTLILNITKLNELFRTYNLVLTLCGAALRYKTDTTHAGVALKNMTYCIATIAIQKDLYYYTCPRIQMAKWGPDPDPPMDTLLLTHGGIILISIIIQ